MPWAVNCLVHSSPEQSTIYNKVLSGISIKIKLILDFFYLNWSLWKLYYKTLILKKKIHSGNFYFYKINSGMFYNNKIYSAFFFHKKKFILKKFFYNKVNSGKLKYCSF